MLQKLNELAVGAKLGIMVVIIAAIAGGGYYFVVMPIMEKNKADQAVLAAKVKENVELRGFVTKLGDLDRQIGSLKQQMELQKRIVPDEKETDKFIVLLQETAASSGISLRKMEAKAVSTKEYYAEVPYEIEIDGPYYGILSFFDKLAAQTRIVNVEALTMKSLAKGAKQFNYAPTDSVTVACVTKTFFSREPGSAPAPAAAATPAKK
jgi:type IV pilus assembly protein PilO